MERVCCYTAHLKGNIQLRGEGQNCLEVTTLTALDVVMFLGAGRSIFNAITSFDDSLKTFRVELEGLRIQLGYRII